MGFPLCGRAGGFVTAHVRLEASEAELLFGGGLLRRRAGVSAQCQLSKQGVVVVVCVSVADTGVHLVDMRLSVSMLYQSISGSVADFCISSDIRAAVGLPNVTSASGSKTLDSGTLGVSTPLRLTTLPWDSSKVMAQVLKVFFQEVFDLAVADSEGTVLEEQVLRDMMGCPDQTAEGCEFSSDPGPFAWGTSPHLLCEAFDVYYKDAMDVVLSNPAFEYKPSVATVFDINAYEGTWLSNSRIRDAGLQDFRSLEWFRGLDGRSGNVTKYFSTVGDILDMVGLENIPKCDAYDSFVEGAEHYRRWLQDTDPDGVQIVDGKLVPHCGHHEPWAGRVWLSPLARQLKAAGESHFCLAFITIDGIRLAEMMQQFTLWHVPGCLLNLAWDDFVKVGLSMDVLMHSWWPDATFLDNSPVRLQGLPANKLEHEQHFFMTSPASFSTTIMASPYLQVEDVMMAPTILQFLRKFQLQDSDMVDLFRGMQDLGSARKSACAWVNEPDNVKRWKSWLPLQCPPGSEARQDQCALCKPGFYSDQETTKTCRACFPGTFAEAAGTTECSVCPGGSFQAQAGQSGCATCSAGRWSSSKASKCDECLPGFFAAESASRVCTACSPGMYQSLGGQTECKECEPGKFLLPGSEASSCVDCPAGFFSNVTGRSSECERCDAGSYAMETGRIECEPCAAPRLTSFMGSTSSEDCLCPAGTYEDVFATCVGCPAGSTCGELGRTSPGQPAGFFVRNDTTGYSVYACAHENCLASDDLSQRCAAGHDENSLACALCLDGFYNSDGDCLPCEGSSWEFPVFVTSAASLAGMVLVYKLCNSPLTRQATSLSSTAVSIGMMLTAVQSLALLQQYHVRWASPFADVLEGLSLLTFDLRLLKPGCFADSSPTLEYSARLAVPLLAAMTYLGLFVASRLLAKVSKITPWVLARTVNSACQVWQALYISILVVALLAFQCRENPSAEATVGGYPSVSCDADEYWGLFALGCIFTVMYGVGFFTYCLVCNYIAPRRTATSPFFVMATRFLYFRFRTDRWFWGSVLMVRAILLAMIPILYPTDANAQVFCLCSVGTGFLVLQLVETPWKTKLLNTCDSCVLVMLILLAAAASAFTEQEEAAGSVFTTVIMLTLCSGIGVIVTIFGFAFNSVVSEWKKGGQSSEPPADPELARSLNKVIRALAALGEKEILTIFQSLGPYDVAVIQSFVGMLTLELKLPKTSGSFRQRICVGAGQLEKVISRVHSGPVADEAAGKPVVIGGDSNLSADARAVGVRVTPVDAPADASGDSSQQAVTTAEM
mmetsp:Transcript_62487/g.167356  ORF Transcript_62487/g.167356 Transcript_62487/m.167356 type:complete len:1288 (-) Transcript_62487:285-4148(-)